MSLPCLQTFIGISPHIMENRAILSGLGYLYSFIVRALSLVHQPLMISSILNSLIQVCLSHTLLPRVPLCSLHPGSCLRSSARTILFGKISPTSSRRRSYFLSGAPIQQPHGQIMLEKVICRSISPTILRAL